MNNLFLFFFSKIIKRMQFSSIRRCDFHKTAKVMSGGQFYDVEIGRYSYAGYDCRIINCSVGSFCSIAGDVNIGGAAHPISHVSTSPVFHSGKNILNKVFFPHPFETGKKTIVGSDVWIGYGAIVMAGVEIGVGSVVGAGSVVTKDIPPYEIWAGNPARLIRKRFSEEIAGKMIASKWWELSDEKLKELSPFFSNVSAFIAEVDKI